MKTLAGLVFLFCLEAYAQNVGSLKPKIGGEYQIDSIERIDNHTFKIFFKAMTPTGKHDTLLLESDHVHVNISEGLVLRISAEILKVRKDVTEVSQVLLFFADGNSRVFALSKNADFEALGGARYLEMHSPSNDFLIF